MGGHHGKSFSARQLFKCIFTTQVLSFQAAQQFAKQIHSPFIYRGGGGAVGVVQEVCVRVWRRLEGGSWWRTSRRAFLVEVRGTGGGGGGKYFLWLVTAQWKHSWCWCVLEVSRANISTALQWQSGSVGMEVCVHWGGRSLLGGCETQADL